MGEVEALARKEALALARQVRCCSGSLAGWMGEMDGRMGEWMDAWIGVGGLVGGSISLLDGSMDRWIEETIGR